ncbi:ribbon-helix-helix domain-containing protein [Chloroflexota bacterium]
MPRPKIIRGDNKDHKVTVRLDNATYESLKEAMEQGKITNLSEALRDMIRRKLWEERFSEEIGQDLRFNEVNEEDLREMMDKLLGNFKTERYREILKVDGVLEGMFSAFGGVLRKALTELEKREAEKRTRKG